MNVGSVFRGFSKKRLKAEVSATKHYVEWLSRRNGSRDQDRPWEQTARETLDDVARCHSVLEGWQLLATANQLALEGLDAEERLAHAISLVEEGKKKLGQWRTGSLLRNLASDVDASRSPNVGALREVQKILHEHHQNGYLKKAVRRRQAIVGYCSLVVGLALLYLLAGTDGPDAEVSDLLDDRRFFRLVALLGWISGSISVIVSTLRSVGQSRIPDLLDELLTTILRPALGAGSGVFVVILLQSGIMEGIVVQTHQTLAAFAIAAGFSEQLLLSLISRIRGQAVE